MEEKKFCSHCGHEIPDGATYCPYCGARTDDENFTATFESKDGTTSNADGYSTMSSSKKTKDEEELDEWLPLIFAIVSFFTGGILFGILAIVFANRNPKGKYSSISRTLGIISIVLCSLVYASVILYYSLVTAQVIRSFKTSDGSYRIVIEATRFLKNLLP